MQTEFPRIGIFHEAECSPSPPFLKIATPKRVTRNRVNRNNIAENIFKRLMRGTYNYQYMKLFMLFEFIHQLYL